MKLVYKGKYQCEQDLPVRKHPTGAVPFKEATDMYSLAKLLTRVSVPMFLVVIAGFLVRGWPYLGDRVFFAGLGMAASLVTLLPHELLHGICFKGEVELWTNLKMGMLFVIGTEDMSRGRFVWMSLLPNLVFGGIPYLLFLMQPQWVFLGAFGAVTIPMGIGDYYNVYNCLTQVPKGALVYLSGMHSYWYLPKTS